MRTKVPVSGIRNEYEPFPVGLYTGTLGEVELRDPQGEGEWLTLRLPTENIEAEGEETGDPGRSRYQDEVTIKTDGIDLGEDVEEVSDELPFQIQRAAEVLGGLAWALGVIQIDEDATGDVELDFGELIDALQQQEFEGERVAFQIGHWEDDDGATHDQYVAFGPA